MPLAIGGILLAAAMMLVMASAGNKFTERSRLVNTADAAAYSGAAWTARHLNFIAYTNRAMIANHVGTGHFIAYVSWVRYIEDTTGNLALVTSFIPVVNAATRAVDNFAEIIREIAEIIGRDLCARRRHTEPAVFCRAGRGASFPDHQFRRWRYATDRGRH